MFDHVLREKSQVRQSEHALKQYHFQKKVLSKIKNVAIVIFYFVTPFLQTPDWCVHYYKKNQKRDWIYKCQDADDGTILYSNLPKLSPWITAFFDIVCLGYLVFFMWYKTIWRDFTKNSRIRFWILLCCYLVHVVQCDPRDIRPPLAL